MLRHYATPSGCPSVRPSVCLTHDLHHSGFTSWAISPLVPLNHRSSLLTSRFPTLSGWIFSSLDVLPVASNAVFDRSGLVVLRAIIRAVPSRQFVTEFGEFGNCCSLRKRRLLPISATIAVFGDKCGQGFCLVVDHLYRRVCKLLNVTVIVLRSCW